MRYWTFSRVCAAVVWTAIAAAWTAALIVTNIN
jgi:hypothetical protein